MCWGGDDELATLVYAAKDGNVGEVESYLDNEDNDPNVKNRYGLTALQYASSNNKAVKKRC
eukprot:COSAG02_NODE_6687_length_3420_cov_3.538392_2_plen_61_part_00